MKRTILFVIIMMAIFSVKAQLRVDSVGNIGVNITTSNTYKVSVLSETCGIQSYATESRTDHQSIGVKGHATSLYHGEAYGIMGCAELGQVFQDGRCYGVYGEAHGSCSGGNYGVFGHLGPHIEGAGVYGSSFFGPDDGQWLQDRYAGYFYGDVLVTGNMTVNGALLYSSDHLYSMNPSDGEPLRNIAYTRQLQKLSAEIYGYNPTLRSDTKRSELLLDPEEGMTAIEKQAISKLHYGLSIEQLEEVFPDLIYDNPNGTKSINYVEMVPILVQAINELNAKIEVLEGGAAAKKAATRATGIEDTGNDVTMLSLGQNKPNPFGTSTDIEVSVPDDVQKAFIYIYDLQGKKIDQVDITARGKQTIQLNAASLGNGMYLYSLIADGKVIVTRRMIVEK